MDSGRNGSMSEVIGEVTRTLIPPGTTDEIRQRVCEQFAESELYSLAWIGRYDPEKEAVMPTVSAGIAENPLDGITLTEASPRAELTTEAVRTREVAVGQDLVDDPSSEDGRDHALEHDYQTDAVVPLVHDETLYGVLHLGIARLQESLAADRELLAEVGVTIAYALETAESGAKSDTEGTEAEADWARVPAESEQERRFYETIVSSTPDLVYAFDLDYRFIYANDALLEMWGQTFAESVGNTLRENGYEPWHAEMHERELDQVVEAKEPVRGEVAFEHAELGRRVYDYIFAPVLDDEGEVEAIAGTTRDVTERKEAEEALQESEERFRALVDASSDVVYRMSPDWSEMHRLEGKEFIADTEESTGDWLDKYIHPNDQERVLAAIDEAIQTKSVFELEHQVEQVDGSLGWTYSRAVPRLDDDGDIIEWVGMASDVTERKEYERELEETVTELQESEERLQLALEAGEMGMWELDPQTGDAPVRSPQHDRIFGYEEQLDEWNMETFLEHVHPDERERVEQTFENALETGNWEFECRIRRADGNRGVIAVQGELYYDSDGEPVRVVGMVQDITEHKERERELERALDLLERTERIADVGGWEIDPQTQDVFWSDHIFDLLEVPGDEEPPLDEALDMYHNEDQQTVEDAVEEALDSGDPFDIEVRRQTAAGGEKRWMRLQGVPETVDDEVVSLRGAVQDITQRKEREQRLEEVIDQLEKSNERLEQFAYAASHDLQEPLRMVSSYLQLIGDRYAAELDEDGQEFIDFAVDGADRMRGMIDGLLQYSRVETQGDEFETVDLDAVFADVRQDLQVKIEETDAEITAEDLPRVQGDSSQLNQVFQNLLDNAIEYSGDDDPRIDIAAERDGDEWLVSVRDEGIGIDPDHADSVFEVFESLHSQDEHDGTGIGLALCERIAERHGGDIWVDSESGEGSTFSFTLPAAADPDR